MDNNEPVAVDVSELIFFENVTDLADVPSKSAFQTWYLAVVSHLNLQKKMGEVGIRLVDSEESQQLNREYRGKDKPTNVLSFEFEQPEFEGLDELKSEFDAPFAPDNWGDLVICIPVVAQEALAQQKSLNDHWAHMVIHGCLHLLGYDHIDDQEAEEMEALERQILASLQIKDPYLE